MKKINLFVLGAVGILSLSACGSSVKEYDGTEVQGVTDTEIVVGNTAATTGLSAQVGLPFNDGLQAVFKWYNATNAEGDRDIRFVHYDDEFDGAKGLSFTKKLIEEDKVFALVGHFGTNTVGATLDLIKEKGIPMVYAATGISSLYQEGAVGYNKAVMPIQPIYDAEGRVLLARALAAPTATVNYGLGGTKIGVIYTDDDAGTGMLAGVQRQARELQASKSSSITYVKTSATQGTDHSAPVNALKSAQCDVIIICANQVPLGEIVKTMKTASYNAKIVTSYVSANTTTLGALVDSGDITAQRPVYTTAWLDITTEQGLNDFYAYYAIQTTYGDSTYALSSYAMAGYIAAMTFLHGLANLADGAKLVWKTFIDAMENNVFTIPMGGTASFANGNRTGVVDLMLNHIGLDKDPSTGAYTLVKDDEIRGLEDIWAAVPAAWRA